MTRISRGTPIPFYFPAGTTHATIYNALVPYFPSSGSPSPGVGAMGNYGRKAINIVWRYTTGDNTLRFGTSGDPTALTVTNSPSSTITETLKIGFIAP